MSAEPSSRAARVALAAGDQLGEGPSWQAESGELSWVDIHRGLLRRWRPEDDSQDTLVLGAPVSFAVVREAGGWLIGRRDQIACIGLDGQESSLLQVPDPPSDTRFNDGKCDAAGRLWAGTMSTARKPGDGSLYRLDPDGEAVEVISSTTISNGLGWSPDNTLLYFVDSTTQRIDVFDFEAEAGRLSDRRTFASIDAGDGLPDGLAVDAEGGVWVCLFGGGALRRYAADGALEEVIRLPVTNPTSPAFGGADLRTLYVTTARHRLTDRQLTAEPLAGAVLAVTDPGVQGLAGHRFAG